jgi:hypothetical protein
MFTIFCGFAVHDDLKFMMNYFKMHAYANAKWWWEAFP